jgi:Tfp pilus assembly protein PilO
MKDAEAKTSKVKISTKHLLVDKNNTIILYAAAITTAVVIFSIFAIVALSKQLSYQGKVIDLRDAANKQLLVSTKAADSIVEAYEQFDSSSESVIGTADNNSNIILDALPSKYDFPALTASIEALVSDSGLALKSITGVDEETQATNDSINPQPIEIPLSISVSGSPANIQALVDALELSIRPFKITSITLRVVSTAMDAKISVITYYQPEKLLDVGQYVVNKNGQLTESD